MGILEDDFKLDDFSPNDEGGLPAPLHIFEHHGIKKKLNVEQVDEQMVEEDEDDAGGYTNRMSHLETTENPYP